MSATKLPRIKWLIRSIRISTAEQLAREALGSRYPADIRRAVEAALDAAGLQELFNRNTNAGRGSTSPAVR